MAFSGNISRAIQLIIDIVDYKATVTRYDLSPRYFCMQRYCANLKAIRYELTSLNRIVANESHRVIIA